LTARLLRLGAVIRTDFLIRLRRPSTAVVFLLLSALPYLWIPAPASGRALMQIGGKRALYNSAAIGMATATLGAIFVGLFGFYVISNALKRDVLSRCGYVIASTTMRASEYIAGKFAGNVVFLTVFLLGFMATSMVMVLVRGEAPLEPWVFASQYLLLAPPAIVFVSAIALVFECTPLLRTKFGDVLYFFLWLGVMGIVASLMEGGAGRQWLLYFDISGFGLIQQQLKTYFGTNSMSIGASSFDAAKGVIAFEGLRLNAHWLTIRAIACVWPLALLVVARLFFHRFDPARVRATGERAKTSWLGRFNAMAKPLARLFVSLASKLVPVSGRPSMLRSAATDALTTIAAFPLTIVAMIGFGIAALNSNETSIFTGVLPVAFAICAVAIADIACREKRAGTMALVFAAPSLRARFVWWKFVSTTLVALVMIGLPLLRAVALRPAAALPLLTGLLFTCAAATTLGVVSSNPKTFIVGFLSFWYVATQDKGASPELDFAGWYGTVTPAVNAAYALMALAFLVLAQLFHARELRRSY
jgi:hypothetical protein